MIMSYHFGHWADTPLERTHAHDGALILAPNLADSIAAFPEAK